MARPTVYATTPTHLLTHTVSVERPTYSVDTAGGTAPTYSAHLTGIAARVQLQTGSEVDEFGRLHTRSVATVFTAGTHDIQAKDRLVYGSRRFEVTSVKNPQDADVLLRLDCEELTP